MWPLTEERFCPRCGARFLVSTRPKPGRPKQWCSGECRRAASAERRAAASLARAVADRASLDAHVEAVLDSPAACRRIVRSLRERDESGSLDDAKWSSVQAEMVKLRVPQPQKQRWGIRVMALN